MAHWLERSIRWWWWWRRWFCHQFAAASGDASVAGSALSPLVVPVVMAGPQETSPSRFPIHSPFAPEISTLGPALVLTASFFNPSVVVVVKVDPSSPAMSPPPRPTLTSPLADLLLLVALVVVVAMQDSSPSAPPPNR